MREIRYLEEFYKVMKKNAVVRRNIVKNMVNEKEIRDKDIEKLEYHLDILKSVPKKKERFVLLSKEGKKLDTDLSYEITELEKDTVFLKDGEDALINHMKKNYKGFTKDLAKLNKFLKGKDINTFITDRDGTINNYSARYMSSVQSVYNSYFLTRFSQRSAETSIILTSAPLDGLAKMSINPKRSFIYAGSKGREYLTEKGKKGREKISREQQNVLDSISRDIKKLLKKPDDSKFFFIGSGFQEKFGQITIARQDMLNSVPRKESENFLKIIKEIVETNDPDDIIDIEDTGNDIEIVLKEGEKGFSKGDGVKFLDREMVLGFDNGMNLICGDTSSDIPMVSEVTSRNKKTKTVFVTEEESLKRKVTKESENVCFVGNPDVLVTGLYMKSKEE